MVCVNSDSKLKLMDDITFDTRRSVSGWDEKLLRGGARIFIQELVVEVHQKLAFTFNLTLPAQVITFGRRQFGFSSIFPAINTKGGSKINYQNFPNE